MMQKKFRQMMEKIKNKEGLTLIELLIVIGVLAILALLIIPNANVFDKAKGTQMNSNSKELSSASMQSYMETQKYPAGKKTDTNPSANDENVKHFVAKAMMDSYIGRDSTGPMTKVNSTLLDDLYEAEAVKEVSPQAKGYIRSANFNTEDFFIIDELARTGTNGTSPVVVAGKVDNNGTETSVNYNNELAGFVFAKKTIIDPKTGKAYNGMYNMTEEQLKDIQSKEVAK